MLFCETMSGVLSPNQSMVASKLNCLISLNTYLGLFREKEILKEDIKRNSNKIFNLIQDKA